MRILIIIGGMFLAAVPMTAKEYVIDAITLHGKAVDSASLNSPLPTVTELIYDDGTTSSYGGWATYSMRLAKLFNASDFGISDCWITGYKVYYYDTNATADTINAYFYDDEGGDPDDGTLYWDDSTTADQGWDWYDLDVEPPVYDDDGDFFGVFDWGSTSDSGGPGVEVPGDYHDFRYYNGVWTEGGWISFIRAYVNDDTDPPYEDNEDPADGSDIDPNLDTITFHVYDDDIGVEVATLDFAVEDESRGTVPGTLDIDDTDPNDVLCTFDVDDGYDFPGGDTVTCTISAGLADELGNAISSDVTWTYSVIAVGIEKESFGGIKARFE